MWSLHQIKSHACRNRLNIISLLIAFCGWLNISHAQNIQPANTDGIRLGIDVLEAKGFRLLRGKRVGLLTHPAGVNREGVSTIDVLNQTRNVNMTCLFGPEHGIYGNEKAETPVLDKIDVYTGLPVYSLYGKYRKPTADMLARIDTLVIDLQDIGTRSYTFVSCMKLAIEACFENGKEVVILDRPNPLGGLKVDGPPLEIRWESYVGAFHVPYVHGMTIGELARMAVSEPGVLAVSETQRSAGILHVVTMEGWRRYMSWPQTGLKWVPTSPFIPDFQAAVGYPMTGLGAQIGGFKHGIGTEYPFRSLRFDGLDLPALKAKLESKNIPGIAFVEKKNSQGAGLYINVVDWRKWRPTELSFYMMQITAELDDSNPFAAASESQAQLFNKHVGSTNWWNQLTRKGEIVNVEGFITNWQREAKQFQLFSRQYWLYD